MDLNERRPQKSATDHRLVEKFSKRHGYFVSYLCTGAPLPTSLKNCNYQGTRRGSDGLNPSILLVYLFVDIWTSVSVYCTCQQKELVEAFHQPITFVAFY